MEKIKQYSLFFLLALAGHLSILGLFAINYTIADEPEVKQQPKTPEIIQASILDETRVTQKAEELKQAQTTKKRLQKRQKDKLVQQIEKEQQRLKSAQNKRKQAESKAKKAQQAERQRLADIKKTVALEKKKQAAIKQQRIAKEKKRLAEVKRQKEKQAKAAAIKKEAEKQQKITDEKQRVAAAEKQRLQKIADDKRRVEAARVAKARAVLQAKNAQIARKATMNASVLIDKKVTQAWNRPVNMATNLVCTIKVNLLPSGDVMSAKVAKSSGDALFDTSAERAVYKASPLPVPKDSVIFEKNFRSFRFNFAPK